MGKVLKKGDSYPENSEKSYPKKLEGMKWIGEQKEEEIGEIFRGRPAIKSFEGGGGGGGPEGGKFSKLEKEIAFELSELLGKPKLSLHGERKFKAVTNWMRKYMEAFPETHDGFLVEFLDDKKGRGYKVELCGEGEEGDERIVGRNYKILPHVFDKTTKEMEKDKRKKYTRVSGRIKGDTIENLGRILNKK